jgi:hypothetical protein
MYPQEFIVELEAPASFQKVVLSCRRVSEIQVFASIQVDGNEVYQKFADQVF